MSRLTRLSAYLLLPMLLGGGAYVVMIALPVSHGETLPAQAVMVVIALLLGILPVVLYRFFIHAQLRSGFACLDDGRLLLPKELQPAMVLNKRIVRWQLFEQAIDTTVRLHGEGEELLVNICVTLTISPDEAGKHVVHQLDAALALVEKAIQESLYNASLEDKDIGRSLDGSTQLNEGDERVLKSKFLSAMEQMVIEGIYFPHDASGIEIDHLVHKQPLVECKAQLPDEMDAPDTLQLDQALLKTLGVT